MLMGKFGQFLIVICPRYDSGGVYALILWRSGLGLLMGKFHHFFFFD